MNSKEILQQIEKLLNDETALSELSEKRFKQADTDLSGTINCEELGNVMGQISAQMGLPAPKQSQIEEMFKRLDLNRNGEIDLVEFTALIRNNLIKLFKFHLENLNVIKKAEKEAKQRADEEERLIREEEERIKKEEEDRIAAEEALRLEEEEKERKKKEAEAKAEADRIRKEQRLAEMQRLEQERLEEQARLEEERLARLAAKKLADQEKQQRRVEEMRQRQLRKQARAKNPHTKWAELNEQEITNLGQEKLTLFNEFIAKSGLSESFQLIFSEILTKNIPEEKVFSFAAKRLRNIGSKLGYYATKPL